MIKVFEDLGIQFLEPSIPAEFFYYFYPSVKYSGYGSSTFANVGDTPSMAVFGRYETTDSNYQGNLEVFMSVLEASDETYGSLIGSTDTGMFLVQDKADFDGTRFTKVKVYDSANKTYKTFVWSGSAYTVQV